MSMAVLSTICSILMLCNQNLRACQVAKIARASHMSVRLIRAEMPLYLNPYLDQTCPWLYARCGPQHCQLHSIFMVRRVWVKRSYASPYIFKTHVCSEHCSYVLQEIVSTLFPKCYKRCQPYLLARLSQVALQDPSHLFCPSTCLVSSNSSVVSTIKSVSTQAIHQSKGRIRRFEI